MTRNPKALEQVVGDAHGQTALAIDVCPAPLRSCDDMVLRRTPDTVLARRLHAPVAREPGRQLDLVRQRRRVPQQQAHVAYDPGGAACLIPGMAEATSRRVERR